LIDENESAKLKDQYSLHIDPTQETYSIEEFFKTVDYEDVPPELMALYAALDPLDTVELFNWQYPILTAPEMKDVYKVFRDIELPILNVTSKMELTGIAMDLDYAQRLSKVYHDQDEELQKKIDEELLKLEPTINA
jgi:DNA polymerase I-like protein with 3'-5' exonuclease and polymerase domains